LAAHLITALIESDHIVLVKGWSLDWLKSAGMLARLKSTPSCFAIE
jgi:hypothetical protein